MAGITFTSLERITTVGPTATTTAYNPLLPLSSNNKPVWPNIRLVDGGSINEGRLQINYKGRWHSVCTNSRNWTQIDVRVACGQLGFTGGAWYRWFARNNDTRQFLFESPACRGDERSIENCVNWPSRRVGGGVCDFHQDIGIRCVRFDTAIATKSDISALGADEIFLSSLFPLYQTGAIYASR